MPDPTMVANPWAGNAEESAVASPETYKKALGAAGFTVIAERNRRDFALDFATLLANAADGPPALGLHLLMGETTQLKAKNVLENIETNRVAPVELIAEKPL